MSYMEYREVQIPQDIQEHLEALRETATIDNPATLGKAGVFDWLNKLSREEGWRAVWQSLNYPFIVLEREVTTPVVEEVQN